MGINKLIFLPSKLESMKLNEDIFIDTKHGEKIQVRIFSNPLYNKYIIVSYANAEEIDSASFWAKLFLIKNLKVNVVLYEYTGYGYGSTFKPSEEYTYNDIDAVYSYLTSVLYIPSNDIVLYGKSIGVGPSCYLAEKHLVGGLILSCPFLSILKIVANFRFTFGLDAFQNYKRMPNIECPIFIIHAVKDEIVPISHGIELYRLSRYKYPPLFIDEVTHNEINYLEIEVVSKIGKFLNHIYDENLMQKDFYEKVHSNSIEIYK